MALDDKVSVKFRKDVLGTPGLDINILKILKIFKNLNFKSNKNPMTNELVTNVLGT